MRRSWCCGARAIGGCLAIVSAVAVGTAPAARAQQPAAGDAAELAKQLSNPVADLVSVPFQFNWEEGVGDQNATRMVLNVQPVVPFELNDDWNLIGRWIMPFVSQPSLAPDLDATFGLSDVLFSAFFSPKDSAFIWGVGPALSLPSTDEPTLGTGKWLAGPTFVGLKQSGPWTYGVLVNRLWSVSDASDAERPDVDRTFVQPFLAYARSSGVTFTVQSEATYDHEASDGDEWTVPIIFSVSKVTRLGPFPFSMAGGLGYYTDSPAIGPERKLRIAFTVILPRNR